MDNPFELINDRLDKIEALLLKIIELNEANIGQFKEEVMNVEEVAKYLSVRPSTIYKMTSSFEIPFSKTGKRLYFQKSEIDAWLHKARRKTNAEIEEEATNYVISRKKTIWT
jgi:excisionase family DNA binding protein